MIDEAPKTALIEGLARLETQLATPAIPGEETAWLSAAQNALQGVERELRPAIASTHREQFAEMRVEDAVLGPQIEALKADDEANLVQLDDLCRQFDKLRSKFKSEANESLLKEDFDCFVEKGLAFVVAVRRQETALQTWFTEAIRRDVGAAD